jgi:hypothetical protein
MADIKTLLGRLGMSEYTTRFRAEGFDTWEVIMDITEADLTYLAVSLTHRKRLQQEISKVRTVYQGRQTLRKYTGLYP